MRPADVVSLAAESLRLHRLRTALSGVAVAIGVAAVLVLAGMGEAAKRYVVARFAAMGANLATISPGRTETEGMAGMAMTGADRDLTLDDADAIRRRVPGLRAVVPMSLGSGAFRYGERRRDVYIVGATAEYATMRELRVRRGRFLDRDARAGGSVTVIGPKLAREVFGGEDPVGRIVRIAERRFRVIGVLEPKGQSLGFDYDELAIVPVATGLRMFDQSSLHHILLQFSDPPALAAGIRGVRDVLIDRHRGEDFTVVTPDAMLRSFRAILDALTGAVAGIAAISVAVAGLGIMNVMLIAVSERIAEVGLLKALGARPRQITALFLTEAVALAALGAVAGAGAGAGALAVAARLWPDVPFQVSAPWIAGVLALALVAGGAFGLMPARRAAALAPAAALRGAR